MVRPARASTSTPQSFDSDTLSATWSCRPTGDGKANYDIELWGWSGNPDPNALLDHLPLRPDRQRCRTASTATRTTTSCTTSSSAQSGTQRHDTLAQMQNLIYDQAPYDILYYDANLDVYRNDKFAGWQNMPADGTPFFTYGTLNYTLLTDATAAAAADAGGLGRGGAAARRAVRSGGGDGRAQRGGRDRRRGSSSSSGSDTTLLLVLVAVVAVVVVVGGLRAAPGAVERRRSRTSSRPSVTRHAGRGSPRRRPSSGGPAGQRSRERPLHRSQARPGRSSRSSRSCSSTSCCSG